MNKELLTQFIKLAIAESTLARVPNQLLSSDNEDDTDIGEEIVDEFCAVGGAGGGLQGFSAPLGASPIKTVAGKKNKRK